MMLSEEERAAARIKFEQQMQQRFEALGILTNPVKRSQLPTIRSYVEQALLDCYSSEAPKALVRFFPQIRGSRPWVSVELWHKPDPLGILVAVNDRPWREDDPGWTDAFSFRAVPTTQKSLDPPTPEAPSTITAEVPEQHEGGSEVERGPR